MKKTVLSLLVLTLGLCSCSEKDLPSEMSKTETKPIPETAYNAFNPKVSFKLAEQVALAERPGTRAGNDIKDIKTVCSEDGEPLMYAVNFNDSKGFILVSASQNYVPILAEVNSGSFSLFDMPANVKYYLEGYKRVIQACNNAPEDSVKNYRRLWKKYLADEQTIQQPVTRSSSPEWYAFLYDSQMKWTREGGTYHSLSSNGFNVYFYDTIVTDIEDMYPDVSLEDCYLVLLPSSSSNMIDKLTETQWNQDFPYNEMLNEGVLGEGPVSMGQIMKYHKKPNSFSWENMPNKYMIPNSAPVLSSFLNELYIKTGSIFINTSRSETTVNNIVSALKLYGYTSARTANVNTERIIENLSQNYPVIGYGSENGNDKTYFWVYDGYKEQGSYYYFYVFIPHPNPDPNSYFHYIWEVIDKSDYGVQDCGNPVFTMSINWGKGGLYDGWFNSSRIVFEDTDSKYHSVNTDKTIIDIK